MPNNFNVTQGVGTIIAADQGVGSELYQKVKLIDPTPGATAGIGTAANPERIDPTGTTAQPVTGTFWPATQPVSGAVSVSNFPSSQPVTGTFFQATQPVSGSVTASVSNFPATQPVSGTVAVSNFPASQVVTGTFFQATQPVSGTVIASVSNFPATQTIAGTVAVSNFPASQAVTGTFFQATQPVSGTVSANQAGTWTVFQTPTTLCVSATGAAAAAVTATLSAVAGNFHYITAVEIVKYYAAAVTGTATPIVVTSTNLAGSLAYTFETAGAIGTQTRQLINQNNPIKSSVVNTATTFVCPATTSVLWRINVYYYTAP